MIFRKITLLAVFAISIATASAQSQSCYVTKTPLHNNTTAGGWTISIHSVVCNTATNTHTITAKVTHSGCQGGACKELSHFSIEAAQNTYSGVSVNVASGSMTYGSISMGWNLGSDPFKGFKIDNTSNIGDGRAGTFYVTYTLTGGLQDQRFLAKAGTYYFISSFTVADFTSVMNCNNSTCVPDSDGDGINNNDDQYPNDSTRAFNSYYPAPGKGTLAFEDLWPAQGDFDMNDLVLGYRFKTVTNASNKVVEIIGTFDVKAFGAGYRNGFGFQFANTNVDQSHLSVTGYTLNENYVTLGSNGLEAGQTKPTFIVFDNNYKVMTHPGKGIGVNTDTTGTYVTPATITLTITFNNRNYTTSQVNIASFNPFIFVNQNRSVEVHLPYYAPTSKANTALFGTGKDASNPAMGKYYVTANNIPWALNIPEPFEWPKEKVDIVNVYYHFQNWSESGGLNYADWYKDLNGYRNNMLIYDTP